jgi:glycosyltransferase involved in cell wall biosynthesis
MDPPRHVLLNALYLAPGVSGGPETYLRGLAPALAEEFPRLRLTVVSTRSGTAALREDGWERFATLLALPCEDGQRLRRQWAEQVLLPLAARRNGADIVHSLASVAPAYPGARGVVTLHDVSFLLRPTFGRLTTLGMGLLVRVAARRAYGLIAGTAAARDEICSVLGVDISRFTVIHHGVERASPVQPTGAEVLRERYGLQGARVVLCVAAKRPHKNQELLVRAAQRLDRDTLVVLVGHAEPYELKLRALSRELGLDDRIRFLEYVSNADLEGLWRIADCAAFPTLSEGFGIPVIEALAHGVAVAASDIPVLREVGGELPHYFDPHDPADAARAIQTALRDTDAARLGPAHAARFSWSEAARKTHAVYERVMAGRIRGGGPEIELQDVAGVSGHDSGELTPAEHRE